MTLFENIVKLRGFLGEHPKAPTERFEANSFALLRLATLAGTWDIATNTWKPSIEWHRIICPGPWFCDFVSHMRRGDYVEVEGELRTLEEFRMVTVAGETHPVAHARYAVHAIHVRKLDRPSAVVDTGEDG
jgi:hypothetical protein